MDPDQAILRQFQEALDFFVEKVQQDRYILAAILFGSLAHDRVWAGSDIDLILISTDHPGTGGKTGKKSSCTLTENGVNLHVEILPRGQFKRIIEGGLQGSFMHSPFSLSRLLFTRDETLRDLYEDAHRLGARDRQVQLLAAGTGALYSLLKAEKWLLTRGDLEYTALWILFAAGSLARVETYMHHQIAGREAILQALELNPGFFRAIYTDLLNRKKTRKSVADAIALIHRYLEERIGELFQPILDYLAAEGTARGATEIEAWFDKEMNVGQVISACEWLADKGILIKDSIPMRLTVKSQVEMAEIAFYYAAEEDGDVLPEGLR